MDKRFEPPVLRSASCLNCTHHRFDTVAKKIFCLHPDRPPGAAEVIRWYPGCKQHVKETK